MSILVDLRSSGLAFSFAATLGLAASTARAQAGPVFSIRNDTKVVLRCMLMEGGPITQLVAIRPGHEHVEHTAPGQAVNLACPALHTSFGPFGPGRYAARTRNGKTEIARLP